MSPAAMAAYYDWQARLDAMQDWQALPEGPTRDEQRRLIQQLEEGQAEAVYTTELEARGQQRAAYYLAQPDLDRRAALNTP